MYIAPRPQTKDDPFFAVRLSLVAVVSVITTMVLQPSMPVLLPALTAGLMGGIRKGFDVKKAVGGPIALIITMSFFSIVVALFHTMPAVLLLIILGCCTVAYYSILTSGNPAGMLLLIGIILMSAVGINSLAAMEVMRDAFIQASLYALIVIPLAYALIPPKNHQPLEEIYEPDTVGFHWQRAFIRAIALFILTVWLYTLLDSTNIMLAIAAVFVLIFPTHEKLYAEAKERIFASVLGGTIALCILAIVTLSAHISVLLVLIALSGLFLGNQMIHGRHPAMVYQFAFSTMLALVIGGLSTQEPIGATTLRITLTIVGASAAVLFTSVIESCLLPSSKTASTPLQPGQT